MTHSTPDPRKPWRNYRHAIRAHERLLRPDERMHASEPREIDREAYRRKVLDAAAIGDDAFLQAELDKHRLTEEQLAALRKNATPMAEWPDEDVDTLLGPDQDSRVVEYHRPRPSWWRRVVAWAVKRWRVLNYRCELCGERLHWELGEQSPCYRHDEPAAGSRG